MEVTVEECGEHLKVVSSLGVDKLQQILENTLKLLASQADCAICCINTATDPQCSVGYFPWWYLLSVCKFHVHEVKAAIEISVLCFAKGCLRYKRIGRFGFLIRIIKRREIISGFFHGTKDNLRKIRCNYAYPSRQWYSKSNFKCRHSISCFSTYQVKGENWYSQFRSAVVRFFLKLNPWKIFKFSSVKLNWNHLENLH